MNVTRLHPAILVRNLRAAVVYYTLWLQYNSRIRLRPITLFHRPLIYTVGILIYNYILVCKAPNAHLGIQPSPYVLIFTSRFTYESF
jgi:hypothetical protein